MAGFRAPYVPGLGLPWAAHRDAGGKGTGRKKGKRPAGGVPPHVPRICAALCGSASPRFQAPGCSRPLGRALSDDEPGLRGLHRRCVSDVSRKGLRLSRPEAGLLVHLRPHGAGRGRSRIRRSHQPSIWVRYRGGRIAEPTGQGDRANFYALVWTTTPWTLPASMALAFNPDFEYVLATDETGNTYIVAEAACWTASRRKQACDLRVELSGPVPGKTFEGAQVSASVSRPRRPGRAGRARHARAGQRHRAHRSGPRRRDFAVGQKYGLETYAPLDDDGRFTEGLPEYKGKTVFEANPAVIGLLKSRGALVAEGKLQHSYPHCWRCHNPVIFRATEQWFMQLDNGSATVPAPKAPPLRQPRSAEIPKVQWTPAWGRERIHSMIAERPDWCISRQRFWGVPLIDLLLRRMRQAARRLRGAAPRARLVRARGRRRLVTRTRRRNCSRRARAAQVRRRALAQGKRHPRRLVRFRLLASRGARPAGHAQRRTAVARGHVSRRPRPISRLVPQFAADRRRRARRARPIARC